MKSRLSALIFAFGLAGALFAQEAAPTDTSPAAPAPAPDRTVYAPRLPSATELTKIATAQGLTIDRIEQTAAQTLVTIRSADGHVTTVAYRLLATAGNWPATESSGAQPAQPAQPATVVVKHQPSSVVYVSGYSYPAYYGGYYGPYWGAGYYAPVAVSVGFGWGYGYGGYHGGYYGGYRGGYCAPYYGGHGHYGGGGYHHH